MRPGRNGPIPPKRVGQRKSSPAFFSFETAIGFRAGYCRYSLTLSDSANQLNWATAWLLRNQKSGSWLRIDPTGEGSGRLPSFLRRFIRFGGVLESRGMERETGVEPHLGKLRQILFPMI